VWWANTLHRVVSLRQHGFLVIIVIIIVCVITLLDEGKVAAVSKRPNQLLLALIVRLEAIVNGLHRLLAGAQPLLQVRKSTLQHTVLRAFVATTRRYDQRRITLCGCGLTDSGAKYTRSARLSNCCVTDP